MTHGTSRGQGPQFHVSVDGSRDNPGTPEAPWDITSALDGTQAVEPGSTIWLAEGTYRHPDRRDIGHANLGYLVRLRGAEGSPIHVSAAAGARVTIDGAVSLVDGCSHTRLWELEILVSEPNRRTETPGSFPGDLGAPMGGLNITGSAGPDCRAINLVIHGNLHGMSLQSRCTCEVYGCIIVDNGWIAPDRGHGHCIYTSNSMDGGLDTIAHCIFRTSYDGAYGLHAYSVDGTHPVENYLVEENIFYERGPLLFGGGAPHRAVVARGNVLSGLPLMMGAFTENDNEDCLVEGNTLYHGDIRVTRYRRPRVRRTRTVDGRIRFEGGGTPVSEDNTAGPWPPAAAEWQLWPNRYDAARASLAVLDPAGLGAVEADLSPFLSQGASYRLVDPRNFFGPAVVEGICRTPRITVPMTGEFAPFVVFRKDATP